MEDEDMNTDKDIIYTKNDAINDYINEEVNSINS